MSSLQDINKEESLLEKDQSQFPMLQTLLADKQPHEQLWTTALNFQVMSDEWMNGQWMTSSTHFKKAHSCFNTVF